MTTENAYVPPIASEPVLGESDHDKAMIALSEGKESAAPAAVATRPDNIPEKFWDAEKGVVRTDELAKSYAELEKARGAEGKPPATLEVPKTETPAEGDPAATTPPADASEVIGFEAFSKEFAETQALSPESYEKLAKQGLSKDIVDSYIEGQKAIAANQMNEGFTLAGGQENYGKMVDWAAANMSPAEIAAYDTAMSHSIAQRNLAIEGLKARYEKSVGSDPKLMTSGGQAAATGASYASQAEVTRDMNDPKYANDAAFRSMVQEKLNRSFN
jgi:hypothetical protein